MSNPDFVSVVTGTIKKLVEEQFADQKSQEDAMAQAMKLFSGMDVVYFRQDKFTTICSLVVKATGRYVSSGVSRRNPIDEPNELRGRALALSRATRHAYGMFVKKAMFHEQATEAISRVATTSVSGTTTGGPKVIPGPALGTTHRV